MKTHTELLEALLRSLDWAKDNSNRFGKLNLNEWETGYMVGYETAINNMESLIQARLKEK